MFKGIPVVQFAPHQSFDLWLAFATGYLHTPWKAHLVFESKHTGRKDGVPGFCLDSGLNHGNLEVRTGSSSESSRNAR